ncbi:MAG: hypothetical protein KBC36_05235 [Spirochaetia bacterium]|nr:hypothetical protein [Spirochaetia bacterium]
MKSTGSAPRALSLLVLLAFAGVLAVNALANALPLNGMNTGELSDSIPNLFVPMGLTFSIWGLIYLGLAAYVIVALVESFGKSEKAGAFDSTDALLITGNFLANIAWIFAWHWQLLPLSLLFMLAILGTLIALAERIHARKVPGKALSPEGRGSRFTRFALSTPIHIYLGWISVATIANVTALLVTLGWDGWGLAEPVWTVIAILAGLGVALLFVVLRNGFAAPLVVVWAYAGIAIKRLGTDPTETAAVWIAAIIAAGAIVLALALRHIIKTYPKD